MASLPVARSFLFPVNNLRAGLWFSARSCRYDEIEYNDALAVRFGYEPRPSSIPADKQTVLLPVGDGNLVASGFSYRLGALKTLDVSLAYFRAERYTPAGASDTSNSLNQRYFIYNPYMGTDYASTVTAIILALSYQQQF